jgi:hypothetical protein
MTRFRPTQLGNSPSCLPFFVAVLVLAESASLNAAKTPQSKPAEIATVVGYAFDPDGKPVANATVCLTKNSDSDDETIEPPVLAQATSSANGRFELQAAAAQIKLDPADPSAVLEIWIHKQGLAAAHATVVAELVGQPIIVNLHNTTGTPIRVLRSDRSPCLGATVTPTHASVSEDEWLAVPRPIKDRLKVQTGADGRANLPNFDGQNQVVSIEKPGYGVQMVTIRGQRPCPVPVVLQPVHAIEGQLLQPKGVTTDLSRIKLHLYIWRIEEHRTHCSRGKADAHWWLGQEASVNRDGQFEFANVLAKSRGYVAVSYESGFVETYPFRGRCVPGFERSNLGVVAVLRVRLPWHVISPVTIDTSLRLPMALPWQIALCSAAWTAWANEKLHVDIRLAKAVRVTRVFRNSTTNQPLSGVRIYLREAPQAITGTSLEGAAPLLKGIDSVCFAIMGATALETLYETTIGSRHTFGSGETARNGKFEVRLAPGKDYEMAWEPPQGFVGAGTYRYESFHVPVRSDSHTLTPIELTPLRRLDGQLADAAGKPLSHASVLAVSQPNQPNANQRRSKDTSRWTITDSAGHFHFGQMAAGTKLTLMAVRHGVPLDERMVTAGDSPAALRWKAQELTSLSGRVLGPDRQPICGAQVAVEVENSPDATQFFQTTADELGRFETPAEFPKGLKYRLVVRSILKSVAASPWICPATAGTHFPDVLVEPAKLGLDKKIPGSEAIALVDGRPIPASEIVERAYPEPLSPDGLSLFRADKGIKAGNVTEATYHSLQIAAFKKYAAEYARTRMLARALEVKFPLDKGQKAAVDRAIDKMFDEYVEKLAGDFVVTSRAEVEQKLRQWGTSLASLKKEFRYRMLADEYLRQIGRSQAGIDRQHLLSYYREHRASFGVRAKVCWQMLEIEFENPSDRTDQKVEQASAEDTNPWTQPPPYRTQGTAQGLNFGGSVLDKPLNPDHTSHWADNSSPSAARKGPRQDSKKDHAIDVLQYEADLETSRDKRRGKLAEARALLKSGVAFDAVAKKFSSGPTAERGGLQTPVDPEVIADKRTADALRQLPEGQISAVIETAHSFRVIRVASRTPAGGRPFEEVEDSIKQTITADSQKEALEELYSRTTVESPYIDKLICRKLAERQAKRQQADAFSE